MKYEFYATEEDKNSGKVIELPFEEDTLTLNEDGSATWVKASGEHIFAGNEEVRGGTPLSNTVQFSVHYATNGAKKGNMFCNYYPYVDNWDDTAHILGSDPLWFHVLKSDIGYLDGDNNSIIISKLKSYFKSKYDAGVGVHVKYQLATPKVTHIPKELVPTILTHKTMICSAGDAVKASEFSIEVPVSDPTESYELTPQNGWANASGDYAALQGHLGKDNTVSIVGRISNTGSNGVICTIPTELRPTKTIVDGVYTITKDGVVSSTVLTGTQNVNIKYRKELL